jgi:hypothetical protein
MLFSGDIGADLTGPGQFEALFGAGLSLQLIGHLIFLMLNLKRL